MFGISGTELVIILLFAFLIVGPDKLPEAAKTIGKALRKFQDAQSQMNDVIKNETDSIKAEVTGAMNQQAAEKQEDPKPAPSRNAKVKPVSSASDAIESAAAPAAEDSAPAAEDDSKPTRQLSFSERKALYEKERAAKREAEKQASQIKEGE